MLFAIETDSGSPEVPNEDWVAATSGVAVLLDGATARTETGCRHGAAWYVRKLGASIIAGAADDGAPLVEVFARAIEHVAALHPECDLENPGSPSAGAAIVRLVDGQLQYLVLGDITVVLEASTGVETISDQRVSQTALPERFEADRYPIGEPAKERALVRMKIAELAAKNKDGGYWIAAADPSVAGKSLSGSVAIGSICRLAMLSDGAARAVDLFDDMDWEQVLALLATEGPSALVARVRYLEELDPLGAAYSRNKKSDDATVLYVDAVRLGQRQGTDMAPGAVVNRRQMAEELLGLFQNNSTIMGGEMMFCDELGEPCPAGRSLVWKALMSNREKLGIAAISSE